MAADSSAPWNPKVHPIAERVSLHGQVALVTGGSRGIGRGIAVALARAGAAVCVFARDPGRLADVGDEIAALGVPVLTVAGDVTDVEAVRGAVERVAAGLGPIDLLVNNAAVQSSIGDCAEVDPAAWWNDVTVNLLGPMLFMRYTLPTMITRRRGRIVNVASNAAWLPFPHVSSYIAAKSALVRMTEGVSLETRDDGIALFSISPGTVKTDLMDYTTGVLNERAEFDSVLGAIELDFISPTFAADLVLALAGGEADVLTGRFLTVHDDLPALIEHVTTVPDSDRGRMRILQA